jgi:hypothetical protein
MSDTPQLPPQPREQLPVPFFDGVVLAVRDHDGRIYLDLRDICEALSLDISSQRRRILANGELHLTQFRVAIDRQMRTRDFLLLEDVPVWILSVRRRPRQADLPERFKYVKAYLVSAVQQAFAQLTGLPPGPSSDIEDLADLDRMEQAFALLEELSQRQEAIEQSQERARSAYRDLNSLLHSINERVKSLEAQAQNRLSPNQRGTIYRMVQTWGQARAERSQRSRDIAMRASWSEVNARFGVSTYTDLPAARYNEIIQFIKDQYRALTGSELIIHEQRELEDLDGS